MSADDENKFTKGPLRALCKPPVFLAIACLFSFTQGMVVTGLMAANISTVVRRYDMSATQAGYIASMYDIAVLTLVIPFSFFGGRFHKPRTLGAGMLCLSAGAFFYMSAQIFGGSYTFSAGNGNPEQCALGNPDPDQGCDRSGGGIIFLFFLGQLLVGIGATPIYTLVPEYLDHNVPTTSLGFYIGVFYAFAALGPAIGFVLSGICLGVWVDPGKVPAGASTSDPNWVGAWWIPYLLASFLALLGAIPMLLFPKTLPRDTPLDNDSHLDDKTPPPAAEDFKLAIKELITNKAFIFNSLGVTAEAAVLSALGLFAGTFVQHNFGISAGGAAFLVGALIVPGAAGGIFLGGTALRVLKLTPKKTALFAAIIAAVAVLFTFIFFFGCASPQLKGINTQYAENGGTELSLVSVCNAQCTCNNWPYRPVCAADGTTYFSPCFAGCNAVTPVDGKNSEKVWSNCTCVAGSAEGTELEPMSVEWGVCKPSCSVAPFAFGLLLLMLFTFMNNSPGQVAALKSVRPRFRAVALAFQSVLFRLLGSIPGPVILGAMLDGNCGMWEEKCGSKGSCYFYELGPMGVSMVVVGLVGKGFSALFFTLSWLTYKSFEDEEEVVSDTSEKKSALSEPSTDMPRE